VAVPYTSAVWKGITLSYRAHPRLPPTPCPRRTSTRHRRSLMRLNRPPLPTSRCCPARDHARATTLLSSGPSRSPPAVPVDLPLRRGRWIHGDVQSELESVKSFCTGSSCASGAEKRGDPRQGPRAAGGAGAPSSRTPPPPHFYELRAAPAPSRPLPSAGSMLRRCDTGAWTREAPAVAASAEPHGGPLPTSSATCGLRPARLGRPNAFCAAPSRAAR
jgi:hypothetical protein